MKISFKILKTGRRIAAKMDSAMQSAGTALVIVDMQVYFLDPNSALSTITEQSRPFSVIRFCDRVDKTVVPAIQSLIDEFRQAARPVIYTQFARNSGEPLPHWAERLDQICTEATGAPAWPGFDDPDAAIVPALSPQDGDAVIRKTTAGATSSSELVRLLRAADAETIFVCGVHTDVCVGQTARELADRNFDVWMIENACASYSPEGHEATLATFGLVFGDVRTADAALRQLQES